MTIKIVKDGVEIWVDTIDELRTVVSALGDGQYKKSLAKLIKPKSIREFFGDMDNNSKGYKLLMALREKPDGMSDKELREKLSIHSGLTLSGPALGGTVAGITKQAKRVGLNGSDIIEIKKVENTDGSLTTQYKLTDKMMEVMPEVTTEPSF